MSSSTTVDEAATSTEPNLSSASLLCQIWKDAVIIQTIRDNTRLADFVSLCLTCKSFYYTGVKFIYDSVIVNVKSKEDAILFLKLEKNLVDHRLARSLQMFQVQFHASNFSKTLLGELGDEFARLSVLPRIIQKCTNLRILSITDWLPSSTSAVLELLQSLHYPQSLRHFTFDLEVARWPDLVPKVWDFHTQILKFVLDSPISSFTIKLQDVDSSSTFASLSLPTSQHLTTLKLQTFTRNETLRTILEALPRLTSLDLTLVRYVDTQLPKIRCHVDCRELGVLLTLRCATLHTLRVSFDFRSHYGFDVCEGGGEQARWGLLSTLDSLESFSELKFLQLAPEVFLGWETKSSPALIHLLPPSLECLHLTTEFHGWYASDWEFEGVCQKLMDFYQDRSDLCRSKSLRNLILECFDFEVDEIEPGLERMRSKWSHLGIQFHLSVVEG